MLIVGVAQEAADQGLGPELVLKLIPFILPRALMYAMPATCLLSVCVVYGRMAADNELIAIKSLGLHPSVVVMPTLFVTFLLSLVAVWVNDISFAWSYWGIERVVLESSDQIVYGMLQNEGSYRTDDFTIEVQGVEDRKLLQPSITYKNGSDTVRVVAHEAEIKTDAENHSLVFTLVRGSAYSGEESLQLKFDREITQPIPLMSPEQIAKASGNPSHLYLSQIEEEARNQEIENRLMRVDHAVQTCGYLITGNLLGLTDHQWEDRVKRLEEGKQRLTRLRLVPHRRWANGFSCFAFAIVGIPIATWLRTANYASTFGVCFLPILLVYYPLFMFGLTGAKTGSLPPLAVWFGNVVCVFVGIILLAREFRK